MVKVSTTSFNKIWLGLVALNLLILLFFPEWYSKESVARLLSSFGAAALAVYILISMVRAFFLIPSTPLIVAGAITFPEAPIVIWFISTIGVVVGAFLVYSLPSFGGYEKFLQAAYPRKIAYLKRKMRDRYAFWIILGWAFFPFVPTDAVCYVAGIAKTPFKKVIFPLLLGQLPLATAYIFLGSEIGEWLRI